jgi:hypothetical protein
MMVIVSHGSRDLRERTTRNIREERTQPCRKHARTHETPVQAYERVSSWRVWRPTHNQRLVSPGERRRGFQRRK